MNSDAQLQPSFIRKNKLSICEGCLSWGTRIVVPYSLRSQILQQLHNFHPGMNHMKSLARSFVWWPNIDHDVENIVKSCHECTVNQKNPSANPIHAWEYPSKQWERIHIDYAELFLNKIFLIVVNSFSKWTDVVVMNNSTSVATIKQLQKFLQHRDCP